MITRLFQITLALVAAVPCSSGQPLAGTCKVVAVPAGDRLEVDCSGQLSTVVLAGIDAPEISTVRGRPGQPFCESARLHLAETVLSRTVFVQPFGADPHGRTLAVVFRSNVNVNLEMIAAGLAEVYRGPSPETLDLKPYRIAEQKARGALLGIWILRDQYFSPWDWREMYATEPSNR